MNITKWKKNQVYQRFQSIYKTMLSYFLKCRKNKESNYPQVARIKNGRIMRLFRCEIFDSKKIKIHQRAKS